MFPLVNFVLATISLFQFFFFNTFASKPQTGFQDHELVLFFLRFDRNFFQIVFMILLCLSTVNLNLNFKSYLD